MEALAQELAQKSPPAAKVAAKPWLKSYPAGVPAEVDTTIYGSLVELLEESFRKHAQRDAAACMDRRLRFGEIDTMSQALGAWLQSKGLERGARVAIMMPNVLQYMVAIAAILRAGYVVVNVNPLYTPRELEHQLKDSGAQAIIVLENFAATLGGSDCQDGGAPRRAGFSWATCWLVARTADQFRGPPCEEDGARVPPAAR